MAVSEHRSRFSARPELTAALEWVAVRQSTFGGNARLGVYRSMNEPDQAERVSWPSDEAVWPIMLCLLGNVRLLHAGEAIPIRAGGKSEVLLSLLALQFGRRIARERLVEAIWPDSDPVLGLRSLNTLVYNLHKQLGPMLGGAAPVLHEDGYYLLNLTAGIGVDITYFDALVDAGDQRMQSDKPMIALRLYHRAAELYRDDLQVATDAHTIMERERLRARYLTLLAQLADYYYRACDYGTAMGYLWRLLARDPYREDAHRLMMRCYVRQGERAAAMRQYQVCTDVLRSAFSVTPEPATIELYDQIRTAPNHI